MRGLNLTGEKYGRLTVIERAPNLPGRTDKAWLCACECGELRVVLGFCLRGGGTVSCGCFKDERAVETHTRHGESKTPIYKVWCAAKRRCFSPSDPSFHNYGGRGITMAQVFVDSWEAFRDELGPKPSPKHTVDREDNDRGYEPGNIRWATRKEQNANRRITKR